MYLLRDGYPDLPPIDEIKALLADYKRLVNEVSVLIQSDLKQLPIPGHRPSIVPLSLASKKGVKGNKGSATGSSGSKGFSGGNIFDGANHGRGPYFGGDNPHLGKGHQMHSHGGARGKGNSFLSATQPTHPPDTSGYGQGRPVHSHEGVRGNGNPFLSVSQPPPPPNWYHPPLPLVSGPDIKDGYSDASKQAMHMYHSQPPQGSMGGNASHACIQGESSDDDPRKTFWSRASQLHHGSHGNGNSWFGEPQLGGPQHRGDDKYVNYGPRGSGWNCSC